MNKYDARPIRSYLWGGINEESMAQAIDSGADAVAFDLEEPVTPYPESERKKARARIGEVLKDRSAGDQMFFVRVSPPETGQTTLDLRAVAGPALTGIMLPKVERPYDIAAADGVLTCIELELGLPLNSLVIYPIIETAEAFRNAYDIAKASPRVAYMGGAFSRFGDIWQAFQFTVTEEGDETLFLRSKALYDVRAAGIRYPLTGGYGGKPGDEEGLRRWLVKCRQIGYFGTQMSRPELVPMVNEVFSPSAEDIAYWQEIDRLTEEAERTGSGAVVASTSPEAPRGQGGSSAEESYVHIAHVGSARQALVWAKELGLVK
jgi:citrate lyase subunit beta/citryl-CoA lyase